MRWFFSRPHKGFRMVTGGHSEKGDRSEEGGWVRNRRRASRHRIAYTEPPRMGTKQIHWKRDPKSCTNSHCPCVHWSRKSAFSDEADRTNLILFLRDLQLSVTSISAKSHSPLRNANHNLARNVEGCNGSQFSDGIKKTLNLSESEKGPY